MRLKYLNRLSPVGGRAKGMPRKAGQAFFPVADSTTVPSSSPSGVLTLGADPVTRVREASIKATAILAILAFGTEISLALVGRALP